MVISFALSLDVDVDWDGHGDGDKFRFPMQGFRGTEPLETMTEGIEGY